MRVLIQGGHVIDPANDVDHVADVFINDNRIAGVGRLDDFQPERSIDARGCLVIPGLVDLCARLREPGAEHKATIASELRAAASAGVTTLCIPPDTDPVIDTPAVVDMIQRRSRQLGLVSVQTLGALTQDLAGERLAEMDTLKAAGCVGVGNALQPVASSQVLRRAFEYAASCDLKVFYDALDANLAAGGVAHEGAVSTRLGLPGIPETAETVAISRALLLAEQTGTALHFCRVTTGRGLALLNAARERGQAVTADAGICYLHLTDDALLTRDPNCHVLPPLRDADNRDALRQGLASGAIQAICSDHQPQDRDAKAGPFVATQAGAATIEQWLALTLALTTTGIDRSRLVASITNEPARILGLDTGTLGTGRYADVCVVDPKAEYLVNPDQCLSAGRNTPFAGQMLKGCVRYTLRRGKFTHDSESA